MVSERYLLHRPAPPSGPKRFLDQRILPAAIDAAGSLEAVVEAVAVSVRRAPWLTLGAAFGAAMAAAVARRRRR